VNALTRSASLGRPGAFADQAPRVLLLSPSRGLGGGIERYLMTVEETLRAGGADLVRLDLLGPDGDLSLATRSRFLLRALDVARRFGRTDSVITGHANLIPVAAAVARLTRASLGPVVFHGTDIWDLRWIDQAILRADPCLRPVAVSSYSAGALSRVGLAPVLAPGISPAWRTSLLAEGARRRPLSPVPTMLSVFRLDDWVGKGATVLLEAVEAARVSVGPIRLVLAGRGPAPGALHELVSAHPDTELHESPTDEALARFYATADLFVLCTRTRSRGPDKSGEGYGIVLLEAQLAGCAVVGPASGGSHDAYQDGVTGQTPVDESAEALADVLRSMLVDRARLARTGRRAAEWAEAATRPEDYTRAVFTTLTGRPPASPVIPQPPPQPSGLPATRARADASSLIR